jgi:hypothetical protein
MFTDTKDCMFPKRTILTIKMVANSTLYGMGIGKNASIIIASALICMALTMIPLNMPHIAATIRRFLPYNLPTISATERLSKKKDKRWGSIFAIIKQPIALPIHRSK